MQKRENENRISLSKSLYIAVFAILVFCVAMILNNKYNNLLFKNNEYERKIQALEEKIEYEDYRESLLQDENDKTASDEYIEEIARERLGLIKNDEIIIMPK